VLTLAPTHIGALEGLAEISLQQGKFGAARGFALRAMKTAPTDSNALLLARIARATGNLEEALKFYEAILKEIPQHLPSTIGSAEIYEEAGYHAHAIAQYENALAAAPHDFELLNRLAKLYRFADSPRLVEFYERVRPPESAPVPVKLAFQYQFIKRKEIAERARRNLPSHALTADDLFFRFAQEEFEILENMADASLAASTPDANALVCKGTCLLARGHRAEAEKLFHLHAAQHADPIYETMMFNDDFYRQLGDTDQATLLQGLPALVDVSKQSFTEGAVFFLSCDINYFLLFTRPLLASMNAVAPGAQVHVHIMNATNEQLQAAKIFCNGLTNAKIALSAEDAAHLIKDT
jgi:tetratricopeptide (TPR) repeat protein